MTATDVYLNILKHLTKVMELLGDKAEFESLRAKLIDNGVSLSFASPEMFPFWVNEITSNLQSHIPYPPKTDLEWDVFEAWTGKKREDHEKHCEGCKDPCGQGYA